MELVLDVARGLAYLHCESYLVLLLLCSKSCPLRQRKTLFIRIYEGHVHSGLIMLATKAEIFINYSPVFWWTFSDKLVWLTPAFFVFSPTVL